MASERESAYCSSRQGITLAMAYLHRREVQRHPDTTGQWSAVAAEAIIQLKQTQRTDEKVSKR